MRMLVCTLKGSFQEVAVAEVEADMFVTLRICHVFRHRLCLFINSYVLFGQNNWIINETLPHSCKCLTYSREGTFHSMFVFFFRF